MAPRRNWVRSNVTMKKMQPYIDAGILPKASEKKWRLPGSESIPNPRPGETICFLSHLLRGLGYPYSDFLIRFLAFYRIRLYDLPTNSLLALLRVFSGLPTKFSFVAVALRR